MPSLRMMRRHCPSAWTWLSTVLISLSLAPRGAKLKDIKTVESHVHALGQCRRIIRKLGIRPIVSGDTAGSARLVAERGDKSCAAIASRLAADIYGLDILAEDVEDETHN